MKNFPTRCGETLKLLEDVEAQLWRMFKGAMIVADTFNFGFCARFSVWNRAEDPRPEAEDSCSSSELRLRERRLAFPRGPGTEKVYHAQAP